MKDRFFFCLSILIIFAVSSCASIKTATYYLPDDLTEESGNEIIRIVQISDLHSNDYGENQNKLVNAIKAVDPDLIFFTGDIFEFSRPDAKIIKNVEDVLDGIKEVCPFFYISGNHEYYYGHDNEYAYLFSEYGGTVLENDVATLELKGLSVVIAGVSDPISTLSFEERIKDGIDYDGYINNLGLVAEKAGSLKGDLNILLAHRPEYIDDYLSYGIYDLVLSGHAHGGQWRLPGGRGFYAPGQGIFPEYDGGRYNFSEKNKPSVFIISRGLSYQVPMFPRFGNPVELVEILVETETFRK